MLRKINLAMIKNKLPKKWAATLSEGTGLSEGTVRNFFSGAAVSCENAERIFDAALLMIKDTYDEQDWAWRFDRAVFLVNKEVKGHHAVKLLNNKLKQLNKQKQFQDAENE